MAMSRASYLATLGIVPAARAASNIACHKNATAGQSSIPVTAGSTINVQWTPSPWPDSHKGPVIDYLAPCSGTDCTTATAGALEFTKIDEAGLITPGTTQTWASDNLIANNNSWNVVIPSSLASGSYVLRHEIIALHGAGNTDGAQNYPNCVNLQVTGSGSTALSGGKLGSELYKEDDPGILVNIYTDLESYTIPGGAVDTLKRRLRSVRRHARDLLL
ncbi:MAG: hypothetical protein Q9227_006231 [Pyrenula ochraceoflavens]